MNESLPSAQDYFVKLGLYSTFEFDDRDLDKLDQILYYGGSLDSFCLECKENSVFTPFFNTQEEINNGLHLTSQRRKYETGFHGKKYYCSRNKKHVHYFASVINISRGFTGHTLTKVGQYPSIADIAENEIKQFKKILGAYYSDLSKAIGLFSHGIGAGSYVYLRRIIENFVVKPAYELASISEKWEDEKYQSVRFKEKMNLLKIYLPPLLVNNPHLYSIVSKGIHDLSEDECKTYFPVLKESIMLILTDIDAKSVFGN